MPSFCCHPSDNEGSEREVLEELLRETRINANVRVRSQLIPKLFVNKVRLHALGLAALTQKLDLYRNF